VRIIAGEFRGRVLVEPKFDTTRPITDRAKQSLFDVLTPRIDDSTVVYDCFSGTGSMGLECLSRGAARAYFFDADRAALDGLRKNIATLKVQDRAKVVAGDLFRLIRSVPDKAGLIFLDPPYRYLVEKPEPLQALGLALARDHAAVDATLIFRHDTKDKLALPGWAQEDVRTYGSMTIELLTRRQPGEG
jgi:16S rRNA (guanine966-N2)-methyltransferase